MNATKLVQVNLSEFVSKGPNAEDNGDQLQLDLKNFTNEACMEEDQNIGQEIKAACKRYEAEGKQMLVLVAEQGHCQWYGSPKATQFIMEQYHFIFKFFTYCQSNCKADTDRSTTRNDENDRQEETNGDFDTRDMLRRTKLTNGIGYTTQAVNTEDFDDPVDSNNMTDTGEESEPAGKNEKKRVVNKYLEEAVNAFLSGNIDEQNLNTCSKCGAKFSCKEHLKTHEIKRLKCDEREFKQKYLHSHLLDEAVTYVKKDTKEAVTTTFRQICESLRDKKTICCPICGKVIKLSHMILKHLRQHNDKRIFECNICNDRFKIPSTLVQHTRKHFEAPFDCYQCSKRYTTQEQWQEHMDEGCNRSHNEDLIGEEEKDENLRCDQCSYKAAHPIMLTAHKTSHNGELLCICTLCGKQLTCMSSLFRHILGVHKGGLNYPCLICDRKFKDKAGLKRHSDTHRIRERNLACKECGKKFSEVGSLNTHIKTHSNAKPYVCDICGDGFRKKVFFEAHRRKHTGERPYCCDFKDCGKTFRSSSNLLQHKRVHSSVSYICDICGCKFKLPSALYHHRKSHEIEWRWPCTYCPEKYNSIWRYKQHLVKYHPEKKEEIERNTQIRLHQCTICDKIYHEPEDLKRHINNHNGIKPFKCPVCFKSYSDKSNLNAHMFIHNGGKKYRCDICYKKFIHEKNLKQHMESRHPNTYPTTSQEEYPVTVSSPPLIELNLKESRELVYDVENKEPPVYVTVKALQMLD